MAQMFDYVEINGIDVTSKRITWEYESEWRVAIDTLSLDLTPSITDLITLQVGQRIKVKRGFVTATDEFVFDGDITQIRPQVDRMSVVCKGRMYDAIKAAQTKSYDKDIDTEAGIGSEIFKSLCDNSQLTYTTAKGVLTSGSIAFTGSTDADKIVKFIQNDEDNFEMMNKLADLYDYMIYYDYDQALVYFQPVGFITYVQPLTVGQDIQNQVKWKINMEQLVNKVKVHGATVYDKINPGVFAGPATTFQLLKTPEDTEVRQDSATGTLYKRGQKGVGTVGVDFDYYVDTIQKIIVFGSNKSNIWVRYGAQVPMPVVLSVPTSINLYGGPNKIPHFKAYTYNDIKDVNDAEDRGRQILSKYSLPFYESRDDLQIDDTTIQTYGNIYPGYLIRVIDNFNNLDINVFVKIVKKSIPHIGDRLTVGDEIWRTEDWQSTQMKKVNLLFSELNKNQDILITTVDSTYDIPFDNRYLYLESRSIAGTIGIYGHPRQGIYGTATYGNPSTLIGFVLGHFSSGILGSNKLGSGPITWNTVVMMQGNNIYEEFVVDNTFYDSTNSVGVTWNTTTKTITLGSSGVLYTKFLTRGLQWSSILLSLGSYTGNFTAIEVTADGGTTWETVSNNIVHSMVTASNGDFILRLTADPAGVVLTNTYDILNSLNTDSPAIKITFA